MSNNNSQSKVGVEMANAMDEAIAKERRKNKKLKQKLSKAKKKLEKQCVDEDEDEGDEVMTILMTQTQGGLSQGRLPLF